MSDLAVVPAFLAARGIARCSVGTPAGTAVGGQPLINRMVFLFGEQLHARLLKEQANAQPPAPPACTAKPAAATAAALPGADTGRAGAHVAAAALPAPALAKRGRRAGLPRARPAPVVVRQAGAVGQAANDPHLDPQGAP